MRRIVTIGITLALLVASRAANANGRFPRATFLAVGPAPADDVIALQATFGLVLSTDGGASWQWVCEPAEGFAGTYDPALAVTRDATLLVTLSNGVARAGNPYCTFAQPPTAPMQTFGDLSSDPSGDTVAATVTPTGMPNRVHVSNDGGATWHLGWTSSDVYMLTIDVAPGHPRRMYLSGFVTGGIPVFLRSDDGGNTFVETTRDFAGGYDAYIAFVDATNPDVVYVRSELTSGATMLLRSADAGATFHEVVRTHASMRGAAISPDGRTIWVGSSDPSEGILRSMDGTATFQPAATGFAVGCLRFQSGTLYACTDETTMGYSLTCSIDGGEHFTPLMSFVDVVGPVGCPPGSPVHDLCEPLWPMQQSLLAMSGPSTRPPRGLHDAGVDAAPDAALTTDAMTDAPRTDIVSEPAVDVAFDATGGEPTALRGTGCACTAIPSRATTRTSSLALLALAIVAARLRRTPFTPRRRTLSRRRG